MDASSIHPQAGQDNLLIALHLEINPALDRIDLNVVPEPRRLQAQRGGEQGFDGDTHQRLSDQENELADMVPEVKFHGKRHRF